MNSVWFGVFREVHCRGEDGPHVNDQDGWELNSEEGGDCGSDLEMCVL